MSNRHQAGRPSKAEELDIKTTLWPYFKDGSKSVDVAVDTEININTIKRYFRVWSTKIFKYEEKEFFRTCKIAKEEALLQIEVRLERLKKYSDTIETKLEALGWSLSPEYAWVHDKYDKLQVKIAKLELEKYNLESLPTADIRLKIDVSNTLKKQHDFGGPDHV